MERDEMTDAAIIYRSHVEAIELLPEEEQLKAYKAIISYCMDDTVPEDMIGKYTLAMARPLLDSWKAKRQAGKKGGESKRKQSEADGSNLKQTEADESNIEPKVKEKVKVKEKDIKHTHGEYKHVRLTGPEHDKLVADYGEEQTRKAVRFLDEYIEEKGYKSKSHYMALRRWVFDAIKEKQGRAPAGKFQNFQNRNGPDQDDMVRKIIAMQTG